MKNEKKDDFYLQDPIFSPQIEDLSIKIYKTNFCDFFLLTFYFMQWASFPVSLRSYSRCGVLHISTQLFH